MEVEKKIKHPPAGGDVAKPAQPGGDVLPDNLDGVSDLFSENMPKSQDYIKNPGEVSSTGPAAPPPPKPPEPAKGKPVRGQTDKHGRAFDPTLHEGPGVINSEGFLRMKPGRPRLDAHALKSPAEKTAETQAVQVAQNLEQLKKTSRTNAVIAITAIDGMATAMLGPQMALANPNALGMNEGEMLTDAAADYLETTGGDWNLPPWLTLLLLALAIYVPKTFAPNEKTGVSIFQSLMNKAKKPKTEEKPLDGPAADHSKVVPITNEGHPLPDVPMGLVMQ